MSFALSQDRTYFTNIPIISEPRKQEWFSVCQIIHNWCFLHYDKAVCKSLALKQEYLIKYVLKLMWKSWGTDAKTKYDDEEKFTAPLTETVPKLCSISAQEKLFS